MTATDGGPTVLKLGGSVITEKDRPETLDGAALDAAADSVASRFDDSARPDGSDGGRSTDSDGLVLVHGGGSFGHHHASDHGVTTTTGTDDPAAVHAIHGAMTTLNRFVLDRLVEREIPAVPVHPFSAAHRDDDGRLHLPTGQVATMLDAGFVPVLHGDLVAHAGEGATVVSGDELVVDLARGLGAARVGLCSTVPGVLDEDDAVIDRIGSVDEVRDVLGESDATDVTGGMAAKVRALLELETPASIFGPDAIGSFLAGERPGTTID